MSESNLHRFLESTILDHNLMALAERDLASAMTGFDLTEAEREFLDRRSHNSTTPNVEAPGMSKHYSSRPHNVESVRLSEADMLRDPVVGQTFDVKPNVVVPPQPFTVNTLATPTPTPTPTVTTTTGRSIMDTSATEASSSTPLQKEIEETVNLVRSSCGKDRTEALTNLAALLEKF